MQTRGAPPLPVTWYVNFSGTMSGTSISWRSSATWKRRPPEEVSAMTWPSPSSRTFSRMTE
eukprot:592170-Prymnesium_polylepis.1